MQHFKVLHKISKKQRTFVTAVSGVILIELILLGLLVAFSPSVSSAEIEARNIYEHCQTVRNSNKEECTVDRFVALVEKADFGFAGDVLSVYQKLDSGYQGYKSCHVLAHEITNAVALQEKGKWKRMLSEMNQGQLDPTRCGGGFMHGVLEARQIQDPSFRINNALFEDLCSGVLRDASTGCAHILGHLTLVEARNDMHDAIDICSTIENDDFAFQCYGGVFMEDSMRTNLAAHGLAEEPDRNEKWFEEQHARCGELGSESLVVAGCWYDLVEVYLQVNDYEVEKTYNFCMQAPTKKARESCYIRGSYLMGLASSYVYEDFPAERICQDYSDEQSVYQRCNNQVVGAMMSNAVSFLDTAVAFCDSRVGDNNTKQCFDNVSGWLGDYAKSSEDMQQMCGNFPGAYQSRCNVRFQNADNL